jgi:predicted AlkP superfamily pyrophosphatase or phosphodiesterase
MSESHVMHTCRRTVLSAVILAFLIVLLPAESRLSARQTASQSAPRLLVLLVLDQFPSEYIELYGRHLTRGLRRMIDEGALFTEAAYPYGATATCAGHSTIGTGAFPQRHGMVGNEWYDRQLDKRVTCEEDPSVQPVVLSEGTTTTRHSAAHMKIPNLADELRRQLPRQPLIVSVAEKARSAIGLGGHGGPGTAVMWRGSGRVWSTSTAYTREPWPDAQQFLRLNTIAGAYGHVWTKLLPEEAYLFVDDDPAEPRPAPWGRTFPHTIHSPNGPDDGVFSTAWTRSPLADAFVVDLAIHFLQSRQLGRQAGTDMLALSLASLDGAGHQYGPRSHEVQDVLARADLAIGRLLDALDQSVGAGNYVVALTADHGVARIPEQVLAEGGQGGRLGPLGAVTENYLQWALGPGRYVGLAEGSQIALTPAALAKLRERQDVKNGLLSVLAASPGVAKVFDREQLSATTETDDPDLRAWRLSFMADRSGDIALIMKPGWIYGNLGTNHGSQNPYDQRVPVMLYGAGVRKGRYPGSASPADVAPTLASLAGITLPNAQGRVLSEALGR